MMAVACLRTPLCFFFSQASPASTTHPTHPHRIVENNLQAPNTLLKEQKEKTKHLGSFARRRWSSLASRPASARGRPPRVMRGPLAMAKSRPSAMRLAVALLVALAACSGAAAAGCSHTTEEEQQQPAPPVLHLSPALNDTDEYEGPHGRTLLQALDCKRVHPQCATCRNQRIPGTKTTQLVCSTCTAPSWRLRQDGQFKTCDCAPGFHKVGGQCVVCAAPSYCPGGDARNPASDDSACPSGLATTFQGAKSSSQCFTVAGFGRKAVAGADGKVSFAADLCRKGWFNVGKNTAGCQKCPAGLTTAGPGANASQLCMAPAGSYMDRGVGRLCPKGTYTTALNRAVACTPCPQGVTTAAEGSVGIEACVLAKRGWFMTGAAAASPCPINTYTDKENTIVEAPCIPCPFGWRTQDVAAEGQAECLAPPGWELKAGAAVITQCEVGLYKPDWNRNPCVACGPGVVTAERGSTARDDCLVAPGWGVASLLPLTAAKCNNGRYGADVPRPALAGATCYSCAPNTFTLDALLARYSALAGVPSPSYYTDETDCLAQPGWGLTPSGLVEQCRVGTYNAGFARSQCSACPAGYTTLGLGKTSAAACVVQPGWALDNSSTPQPCDKGTWSPGGVEGAPGSACYRCPWGYTTQEPASDSFEDCNACDAGHGGAGCAVCTYDTFATGGQREGQGCWPCAEGTVSSRRRYNSEHCYPIWLEPIYDTWQVSDTSLWVPIAAANTSAACAEACDADTGCIMYRYAPASRACEHLPKNDAAAPRQQLAFQVAGGDDYLLYFLQANVTVGAPLKDIPGYVTLLTCLRACNADNKCEAASFLPANGATTGLCSNTSCPVGQCALRVSVLDADWVGQVHTQGPHLYSDQLPEMTFYATAPPAAPAPTNATSGGGGTGDLGGGGISSIGDLPGGLPTGDPIDPPTWPVCSYDNATGVHNLTEVDAPDSDNNSGGGSGSGSGNSTSGGSTSGNGTTSSSGGSDTGGGGGGGGSISSIDDLDPEFSCAKCEKIPSWANGYESCMKNQKKCAPKMETDDSSSTCGCAAATPGAGNGNNANDAAGSAYLYTGGSYCSVNCDPAVHTCHVWTAAEQSALASGQSAEKVCHRAGRIFNGGAFFNPALGLPASCVCAKPPAWTCHAWTTSQRSTIAAGASQQSVCENQFPYNKFSGGNNANREGCGNCGCCSRSWQCQAYSDSDLAAITRGQKTAQQVCEQGNGVYTQGANAAHFGCGSCHCCRKPNMGRDNDD